MPYRLSIASANRYLLAKQHLTPDSAGTQVLEVAQDIGPLRGAPPITPYLSLWARIKRFSGEQLDAALYVARELQRIPCLHSQLCLVPTAHLQAYFQTTRPLMQEALDDLNELVLNETGAAEHGSLDRLTQRVLEVLSAGGPLTIDQLSRFLPELDRRLYHDPDAPEMGYSRLGTHLLPALCAHGLLARAQPRGGWHSNAYTYATLSSWLPGLRLDALSPREALSQVVWLYVRAYGPVTIGDVTQWVGGYSRQEIVAALSSHRDGMQRVQLGSGLDEYYLATDQIEPLMSHPDDEPHLVLLPAQDSLAMAYSDTSRFLEPLYRDRVYGQFGEALGTLWIDGRIVGTWRLRVKTEEIVIRFFESVSLESPGLDVWSVLDEKARSLAALLEFDNLCLDIGVDPEGELAETEASPEPERA